MRKLLLVLVIAAIATPLLAMSRNAGSWWWYGTVNFLAGGMAGRVLLDGDSDE